MLRTLPEAGRLDRGNCQLCYLIVLYADLADKDRRELSNVHRPESLHHVSLRPTHPHPHRSSPPSPPPKRALTGVVGSVLAGLMGTGVLAGVAAYGWNNGLAEELCSRSSNLRFICPQELDRVTDEQAKYWVSHAVRTIDSPLEPSRVYDQWIQPAAGVDTADEKARLTEAIGRIEAMGHCHCSGK